MFCVIILNLSHTYRLKREKVESLLESYTYYKKLLLLVLAYGGTYGAFSVFPQPRVWRIGEFIGTVLFSPLQILIASFLFIASFLAYSLFVQDLIRLLFLPRVNEKKRREWILFVCLASLSVIHLVVVTNWIFSLPVIILALLYGIMDVNLTEIK